MKKNKVHFKNSKGRNQKHSQSNYKDNKGEGTKEEPGKEENNGIERDD